MFKSKTVLAAVLAVCMAFVSTSYATFGMGLHYILDFSVKMDAKDEQLTFDSLTLTTTGFGGTLPSGWSPTDLIQPENIPISFSRGEMERTPFGLGAKIYVDIIPFIDCIEIGGGFAAFQYDGSIIYPSSINVLDPTTTLTPNALLGGQDPNLVEITYDTISTNVEDIEGAPAIPGISLTPYAKLEMGLTIRKYIPIPAVDKFLKP